MNLAFLAMSRIHTPEDADLTLEPEIVQNHHVLIVIQEEVLDMIVLLLVIANVKTLWKEDLVTRANRELLVSLNFTRMAV